eukprot:CAMPEP_0113510244 /NCGR_PEP_ID=MMETSP0014_2-20120614/38022_1 /TAXON_ID=2857 /ORGANISM="Nitzschia sp." /LENGTH=122 /DNA_ID=CAMNT_0000406161 /DNA_START=936 /DNA_END=1305 /DNA_ORIENTATION=- /assembly_acc=CAM_ASM_000159
MRDGYPTYSGNAAKKHLVVAAILVVFSWDLDAPFAAIVESDTPTLNRSGSAGNVVKDSAGELARVLGQTLCSRLHLHGATYASRGTNRGSCEELGETIKESRWSGIYHGQYSSEEGEKRKRN